MNCRLGADIIARARLVLDDELLAQPLRKPLRDDARRDVGAAAGGVGNDPAHRPGRIVERRGAADPAQRERGEADGEKTDKIDAGPHGASLRFFLARANDPAAVVAQLRGKVRGLAALAQGYSP